MQDEKMPVKGFGDERPSQFGKRGIEPRCLMLNGYRSAVADIPEFGVKKGRQCLNCHSMVYLDKCPNDACYNFQVLTSFQYNLEERIWEMLAITDNSKSLQPTQ